MDWEVWNGKKVFLMLVSNHAYNGKVISADNNFISIIDKFGKNIVFNTSDIKLIKEEG